MLRTLRRPGLLLGVGLGVFLAGAAVALEERNRDEDGQRDEVEQIITNPRIAEALAEARDLLQEERYVEARDALERLRRRRLDPYPLGLMHQLYGYIAAGEEDYAASAEHFSQALATGALPPAQMSALRFNLAQIHMMNDQWDQAIARLEEWFEHSENPTPIAWYMLAIAYYQDERPGEALEPARKAVELSEEPREPWLQLLISLHLSEKRFDEALPLLRRLALRHPKKQYWTQLAAVLMELERDEESLAVQQLSARQGLLEDDRELTRLAQMYLYLGLPWEGAQSLEASMEAGRVEADAEAWSLLANSLLAARENDLALAPLEKAADLSASGSGYLRLGQVHMQSERWTEAQQAFELALDKGELDKPAYAHLLRGITAYQLEQLAQARRSLQAALSDEATAPMAETWLEVVERASAQQAEDLE